VWRLVQRSGGTQLFYKTAKWHLYKTGGRRFLNGDAEFRVPGGPTLKLPGRNRKYRGALRFTHSDTVNVLNLEKYVRGVIAAEMPPSWPTEALAAQAVAARTYAARERADHANDYYQICDTARCQVYGGAASEFAATNVAAASTIGQVLTFGGQIALAQFSSSNGGWTSAGGYSYLPAQQDVNEKPYDKTSKTGNPYYNWTQQVSLSTLQSKYPQLGTITGVRVTERENGTDGWVSWVEIDGAKNVTIKGTDFEAIYGLRSAFFSLSAP
jgi:SpoIID/LytB domain protein